MINPENNSSSQSSTYVGFKLCLLLLVLWATSILALSLVSNPPQISGILGWDKLLHAGAYGLLSLLIALVLLRWPTGINRPWLTAWIMTVCYGALLELLQMSVQTGRTAEWSDLFADALGALVSCVIFRHLMKLSSRHGDTEDRHHG